MLKSKAYIRRTRKGNVVKVIREHCKSSERSDFWVDLRDDIGCGLLSCQQCVQLSSIRLDPSLCEDKSTVCPVAHYIVADTNVLFHQIDIMEHPAFKDVIVLQTTLEELKNRSLPVYNRIRTLTADPSRRFYVFSNEHHRETYVKRDKDESPNDRNDRAIRRATEWYDQHLKSGIVNKEMSAILLTDDLDNKLKARQQGLRAYSVREYVEAMTAHPELMDMIANVEEEDLDNKKFCYDEHLTPIQISAGLTAGTLYQGTMAINPHNFLQGSIFANIDGEERTVTIHGRLNLNRAINGDIVAVQLLPKEEWKAAILDQSVLEEEDVEEEQEDQSMAIDTPEQDIDEESSVVQPVGKVVGIIKKNWRPYAGNIDSNSLMTGTFTVSTQNVWFWPMDKRIPRIRIRTRQVKALVGKRIIVAIDSWSRTSKHPSGHFVKIVGEVGEKKTETEVLLHEHDVPYAPFSQNVLACLPSEGESWIVTDKELPGRRDFRHLDVCSIDPPGCTDIDDALHARLLPNGNYEVGVHIADVSHFVKANTPMDTEASRRGTTVYLVDKRIDMLPGLLGTNLCSLRSHVDRLSFSCIWEMTPEAEIVDVQFTKSIIRSRHSFTYDEAQARLDDPNAKDPVSLGIKLLDKLAKQLRQRRMDRGALVLASPEVRFKLENDSQDPVDVEMKELKDTNALVEEFMLLANISVAKKIVGHFPESSMLRRHPKPPNSNFDGLKRAAARFGFNISAETSKHLADSLDLAMIPDEPYFNKLIRIMTTRCMMQAVYFSSGTVADVDYWHYGLATEIYTHFTSPIRRYADLIVHRLLAACIGYEKVYSTDLTDKSRMSEISDNLNYRHRQAQQASRSSVELYTNLYFRNKTVEEEAFVIRVVKNGFIVLIPKYGIEGIVHIEKASVPVTYNPIEEVLQVSDAQGTMISLFKRVKVKVTVQDAGTQAQRSRLVVQLVEPFIAGLTE